MNKICTLILLCAFVSCSSTQIERKTASDSAELRDCTVSLNGMEKYSDEGLNEILETLEDRGYTVVSSNDESKLEINVKQVVRKRTKPYNGIFGGCNYGRERIELKMIDKSLTKKSFVDGVLSVSNIVTFEANGSSYKANASCMNKSKWKTADRAKETESVIKKIPKCK